MRSCVRLFRKSPVKNDDVLQEHVKAEFRREFSDEEFNELEDLIATLEPVKIGTEALCRRDATLISADEVTKFIYQQLNMQTSSFSKELLASFIKRINQRRNLEVMALLLYLNDPDVIEDQSPDVFRIPQVKRPNLAKLGANIFCRLFEKNCNSKENNQDLPDNEMEQEEINNVEQPSLAEQLEQSIRDAMSSTNSKRMRLETSSKSILKEMSVFELTKTRTKNLDILFNVLKGICVTSVKAERSFSASGLFVTKLRICLNDDTLDIFCMLRAYYLLKRAKM